MNKIIVIGIPGAGKSTLSIQIGEILSLPVFHLDQYFWNPGWLKTEDDLWLKKTKELISGDRWIIDGNYSSTLDIRLPAADTLIFLDFSTIHSLWRVSKRVFTNYNKVRADMAAGCPDKIDLEFLKWIINFKKNQKPIIQKFIEQYQATKKIIVLKNASEVNEFVKTVIDKHKS